MSRRTLTDKQWKRIEGHLPGRVGARGRSGVDNRLFVDAVLWMAANAARWRDLPDVFGKWSGVHARFRRWSHAGVWQRLFQALADTPDFDYVLIDSTIAKVHADATGAKGGCSCRDRPVPRRPDHQAARGGRRDRPADPHPPNAGAIR